MPKGRIIRDGTQQTTPARPKRAVAGSTRIVRASLWQAEASAGALHDAAVKQARRHQQAAEEAAQQMLEQARAEGDRVRARAEFEAAQRLAAAQRSADEQLTPMAVAISEKLIGAELQLDPQQIASIVAQVVSETRSAQRLIVYVAPVNMTHLQRLVRETDREIVVKADAELGPADCVIDTNHGRYDARLSVRLSAVERVLSEETEAPADTIPMQTFQVPLIEGGRDE